jgi:hypothetical protein
VGLDDRTNPRPQWLPPTDTSSSQGDVFGALSGSGVRVETDQLKTFSTGTLAQAQAFQQAFSNGVSSLLGQASQVGASTTEAAEFSKKHAEVIQQLAAFTQDAGIGLMALGQGAQTIAINYVDSDATQSATLSQVTAAFSPDPQSEQSLRYAMTNPATDPSSTEVTDADQAVADAITLPEPDDLTPDSDAPDTSDDPRAGDQVVDLGGSGDTYTVPADDDIELIDPMDNAQADQERVVDDGDDYLVGEE